MNIVWASINTTSLESTVSNIIDISLIFQVDGKTVKTKDWSVQPILHIEDALFGGCYGQSFVDYYNKDAGQQLALSEFGFTYSVSTLNYLKLSDADLINRQNAKEVLFELLADLDGADWILAGHSVAFLIAHLKGWSERCDEVGHKKLLKILNFDKSIDTIPFFKTISLFRPLADLSLKSVAQAYGKAVGLDTKSKIDTLYSICGSLCRQLPHPLGAGLEFK
jgi:hypothetical protein